MAAQQRQGVATASPLEERIASLGRSEGPADRPTLIAHPLFRALQEAGTFHVYADTSDVEELGRLLRVEGGILSAIDGNTANQPLVRKVISRYLENDDVAAWAGELQRFPDDVHRIGLNALLYTVLCGRIGNDMVRAFASGRPWEVSLQVHMGLMGKPHEMKRVARMLRRMVPSAIIKVPFAPHAPDCFLVARDLELEGIPVNFTSTFSARQVVAAGLLSNVTRTNVFMGRLDQGLQAKMLGAHVDLEAQRALGGLRMETGIKTLLIVASMREWRSLEQTAGCDVYTAPCDVLRDFLGQSEVRPEDVRTQLTESYENRLGIGKEALDMLGAARVAALYRVDAEFTRFLKEYRMSAEYRELNDAARLVRRFEEAGFKDFFYFPEAAEWEEFRRGKIPDLHARTTKHLALDTLYSLLADVDFGTHQDEMDQLFAKRLGRGG